MSNLKTICVSIVIALFSTSVFAAGDTGKIISVYSHPTGAMAIQLENGLPGANAVNNCGTYGNTWAGVSATDSPSIKAAILSAKIMGASVTLVTLGNCQGGWIKIEALQM